MPPFAQKHRRRRSERGGGEENWSSKGNLHELQFVPYLIVRECNRKRASRSLRIGSREAVREIDSQVVFKRMLVMQCVAGQGVPAKAGRRDGICGQFYTDRPLIQPYA